MFTNATSQIVVAVIFGKIFTEVRFKAKTKTYQNYDGCCMLTEEMLYHQSTTQKLSKQKHKNHVKLCYNVKS